MPTDNIKSIESLLKDESLRQLEHDFRIVQLLLKRNYAQHHRAIYFRRLQMAYRFMVRNSLVIIDKEDDQLVMNQGKENLCCCALINKLVEAKKLVNNVQNYNYANKKKKLQDEKWVFSIDHNNDRRRELKDSRLLVLLQDIFDGVTAILPECFDRIECAAISLFETTSNGFFLPFTMVALSALARIRAILKSFGYLFLKDYQEIFNDIYSAVQAKDEGKLRIWGNIEDCQQFLNNSVLDMSIYEKYNYTEENTRAELDDNDDSPTESIALATSEKLNLSRALSDERSDNDIGTSLGGIEIKSESLSSDQKTVQVVEISNVKVKKRSNNFDTDSKSKKGRKSSSTMIDNIFDDDKITNSKESKEKEEKKKSKKKKKKKKDFFDDIFD